MDTKDIIKNKRGDITLATTEELKQIIEDNGNKLRFLTVDEINKIKILRAL